MLVCICLGLSAHAESAYIIDRLMAGLHADKSADSPILKIIPTGTELKILEQDGNLTYVEDPDGDKGWVDNAYLMNERPGREVLQETQERNRNLEVELENAKLRIGELEGKLAQDTGTDNAGIDPEQYEAMTRENAALQQQVKSEQLKTGELQARITELRKNIAQADTGASLDGQLQQLESEKLQLEQQLAKLLEESDTGKTVESSTLKGFFSITDWRAKLAFIAIILIIGLLLGAFLLDYMYRRRHGGFRI